MATRNLYGGHAEIEALARVVRSLASAIEAAAPGALAALDAEARGLLSASSEIDWLAERAEASRRAAPVPSLPDAVRRKVARLQREGDS